MTAKQSKSPWESWSKRDLKREIQQRMLYFYGRTDGTIALPNSAEGDILKMVHILLTPRKAPKSLKSLGLFLLGLASLTLPMTMTGCASAKITHQSERRNLAPAVAAHGKAKSGQVTVSPALAVLPEGENPKQTTLVLDKNGHSRAHGRKPIESKIGQALADETKKAVAKAGAPKESLTIESRITVQEPGSRALRALVGLGAGRSRMDTRTLVFVPGKSKAVPWLEIWTTSHSGREPGAIFSAVPSPFLPINILNGAGIAGAALSGSNKGLTQDAKRTGKVIGNFVAEKLGQNP
jgi:hypothetical protein